MLKSIYSENHKTKIQEPPEFLFIEEVSDYRMDMDQVLRLHIKDTKEWLTATQLGSEFSSLFTISAASSA